MTIVPQGTINTAALVVPNLYVQIVPPQQIVVTGVPSNIIGVVGSAAWGPVNVATTIGDMPGYVRTFGAPVARKFDAGTHVAVAIQQGANAFRCVRVTDGTDLAATSTGVATCISFTALYTGSLGNNLTVTLATGSKANTFRLLIGVPGGQPEQFDNIAGTGNAFWVNLAAAINSGTNQLRPKSNLIIATAGVGTTAATPANFTFSGGTDGAGISATNIMGVDTTPRTGMFALRATNSSILMLSDLDDTSRWTTADGFALGEGMYNIVAGPSGDNITNAVATKRSAGVDSYSTKVMLGDWITWNDPFNAIARVISPIGFVAGRLANLSPEQSTLNKPMFGVVGSQRSSTGIGPYSDAELTQLTLGSVDVITNPGAGGLVMWTDRVGRNSSSNVTVHGDNYTRMTNFIATSLNASMGVAIGRPITLLLCQQVKSAMDTFFLGMKSQGMISTSLDDGGLPFGVLCDLGPGTNNPPARTKLGFLQADVQVQYMSILEVFIVNLEGGQTVSVNRKTTSAGQITA